MNLYNDGAKSLLIIFLPSLKVSVDQIFVPIGLVDKGLYYDNVTWLKDCHHYIYQVQGLG